MIADGSSSWTCKFMALLLTAALHGIVFRLANFDMDTPSLAQPQTTRVHIFPVASIEVDRAVEDVGVSPPRVEPSLEPDRLKQEEPSPVEIPEPEPKPVPVAEPEPVAEPVPVPIPEPKPEPPPPAALPTVADPQPPSVPSEPILDEVDKVESPEFPEPSVVKAEDNSDGSFDVPPIARRVIKPEYPLAARQEKWEGEVVCEVLISKRGKVLEASVVESCGHDVLDAAALKAVRVARFAPALRRGHAVEVRVRLTVDFRLDSPHHP